MGKAGDRTDGAYRRITDAWERLPWQTILLTFVGLFLLRNLLLPMAGDDYAYAFIWDPEHGGNLMDDIGERIRIASLSDILASQWEHYFSWGGRTISMLFLQFFAWQGKIWFDLCNTVVYLLLGLVIYWTAAGRVASPARYKGCFLWGLLGLQFGVLDYISTMLWMTGACVYLWTGFWECAFLLPYALAYRRADFWKRASRLQAVLMAAAGLCAGWSEEGGGIAALFLLAMFLVSARREGRLRPWMVAGAGFFLLGFALLLFCPGSIMREKFMLQYNPEYVLPMDKLWSAEMFWDNFTEGFLPIFLWQSFLYVPLLLYFKNLRGWDKTARLVSMFAAAGLLVLCAMMFAPSFGLRTGFHSTVFFTIASAMAVREIAPRMKELCRKAFWRRATVAVILLCLCYGAVTMAEAVCIEASIRRQFDDRIRLIQSKPKEPLLVVPALQVPEGWWQIAGPRSMTEFHLIYGADLESKPTDNRSLMFARYYGIGPICIDKERNWEKF
ncbi:MAG: hypothetical protein IJ741_07880 [Schwartzia sp.]|nr:hypothetical protein [Schwartzia sp. (in: firmicutes)]